MLVGNWLSEKPHLVAACFGFGRKQLGSAQQDL